MNLSHVLRGWREAEDIEVREAARMIGIPFTTLSRIERGFPMDGATLAKIVRWLLEARAE